MHRPPLLLVVASLILLAACQGAPETKDSKPPRTTTTPLAATSIPQNLASLTPYPVPKDDVALEAPAGFEPTFAQNVARHGARSLTSDDSIEDIIKLWDEAKQADALTDAGKRFGPDARALRTAMERVGFGELNTLGEEEMQGIGKREGERLADLFEEAIGEGAKVDVFDSGKGRAEDSATNFSAGLASVHPELDIEPPEADEELLKFDNENEEYEDFLEDGPWIAEYNRVRKLSNIDDAAKDALSHLFTPEFAAGIDKQLYYGDGIFDVYRSGLAMSRDVNVDTSKLMPKDAADAFAYVEDGRYFYSRGPGVEGTDDSYQAAQILLDDFFTAIDEHINGRPDHQHVAVYRFAHAEELTPFTSMLELPVADEQGKPGETYTHENNDFRVWSVAPLSGNIEWTLWENGEERIVSIRQNELPTTVGRDCELYEDTENFYELKELRSCLGATQ